MAHSRPDFTQFPPAQKAAYLGAIASLTTADRQASPAEVEFLSRFAEATGLGQADAQQVIDSALDPGSGSLRQSLDALKPSDLRFSLVQDLISYAQSDGQYSREEQERIGQIATYLGVSQAQYDALRQYQQAAADGQNVDDPKFLDQSGLGSRFSQLGLPKGGGMLSGLLASVLPMVLQHVLSPRGAPGRPGAPAASPGGGLADILGQVMGGARGTPQQGSSPTGGLMDVLGQVMGGTGNAPQRGQSPGGGLMDILGQVMRGAGQPPRQAAAPSSGMGGLGQLLRVLGQQGVPGAASPQHTAPPTAGAGGYAAAGKLIGGLFQ